MAIIQQLDISVSFPETTIRQEHSRNISLMSKEELRICFPGKISFIDEITSSSLLVFEDVPIFGFAIDFTQTLNSILSGNEAASFVDFYGEFEITLKRKKHMNIEISDTFRGGNFEIERRVLLQAYQSFTMKLSSLAENVFPELLANPHFINLCNHFTLTQK